MAYTFVALPKKPADPEFMAMAEKVIDKYIPKWDFEINPDPALSHFIGVSGGVDSSALVATLLVKHPETEWNLIFTDTGNEPHDVMDIIDLFADKMGASVTIAKPDKGLFEKIEDNGFLPGAKARWCTAEHLIHPLMRENLGVYSQLPVAFSTSVSGLTRSVNGYMYHRRTVADGFYVSESDYEAHSHITALCLKFPRAILPKVDYDQPGVYTWSAGISYAEIGFTLRAIQRLCHYTYCKQMIELSQHHWIDSRTLAESRRHIELVEQSGVELGEVIGLGHLRPKQKMAELRDDSYDESPKTVRCIACSL